KSRVAALDSLRCKIAKYSDKNDGNGYRRYQTYLHQGIYGHSVTVAIRIHPPGLLCVKIHPYLKKFFIPGPPRMGCHAVAKPGNPLPVPQTEFPYHLLSGQAPPLQLYRIML